MKNVDELATSVPVDDLRTVVTELGKGFDGTGDDLETLVDSLDGLARDGYDTLPTTVTLIRDSRVVLDTQSFQASPVTQFSRDLDAITAQLRSNDPDLRRLIDTGTSASTQLGGLVNDSGPALTRNLSALADVTTSVGARTWALRPLFQMLPSLAFGARSVTPGDSTIHLGLVGEVNNPPACTQGYEGTQRILDQQRAANPDFDETAQDFPIDLTANCTTPQGSITGVRSANRAIFADPAQSQPWDDLPKTAPDPIDLNPIATQLAGALGVTVR